MDATVNPTQNPAPVIPATPATPAASTTAVIPVVAPATADVDQLRSKLEATQGAYISAVMEKNFLQRAMADLNFHNNAHDGIVFTDKENRVVYANPYFLRMMGITDPADLLNKPLPDYMWSNPSDPTNLFRDVHENGFVRERDLSLYNRDKQPIFVACSSVASKDDLGNFVGTEIMLCNVTTKHRIQNELVTRTETLATLKISVHRAVGELTEAIRRDASHTELIEALNRIDAEVSSAV